MKAKAIIRLSWAQSTMYVLKDNVAPEVVERACIPRFVVSLVVVRMEYYGWSWWWYSSGTVLRYGWAG